MYCIGLTGTIASGKSIAMAYFKEIGIETINADTLSRQLTEPPSPFLEQLIQHFGNACLDEHGLLDRPKLRAHIIKHPSDKHWLEQLLHPEIRRQIEAAIKQCHGPYCVIEIPLLLDRTPYPYLNRVLLITAEREHQIQRIIARDGCDKAWAAAILDLQETNNHRPAIADDIILNNGSMDTLYEKLYQLHQGYLRFASEL
jgi:dephospho-CoA kinase